MTLCLKGSLHHWEKVHAELLIHRLYTKYWFIQTVKGHGLLLKTHSFFLFFFLTYFSRWNQVNIEIYSCSTHWAQSQYLFLCLWGNEARAAVVQTIIICAGSKKSHVSQFMSAAVAPSHGWFRIWNKLRNHFLCSAVIHLFLFFPDTQTPTACFLSNWRDQQVRNNLPHFFHQLFFF